MISSPLWSEVKVVQWCLTLCDPIDYTAHGILQAGILEWVNFPFSRESSQPRNQTQVSRIVGGFFTSWATRECFLTFLHPLHPNFLSFSLSLSLSLSSPVPSLSLHVKLLSRVRLFATLWIVARQIPLSMAFSRQEYWSELLWPPPGDLLDPGMEPRSPALADECFYHGSHLVGPCWMYYKSNFLLT